MKILIATGIYPPQIGGPAQYAKNLAETFRLKEHTVSVLNYKLENKLPPGVRHLLFFFRMLVALRGIDFAIALDTFSVGLPGVLAAKIWRKKFIVRTGGDFLWEQYVERTKDMVLFRDFYDVARPKWSRKERLIFFLTSFLLRHASAVVFSTEWQRGIWRQAYDLDLGKTFIIEYFFGPKKSSLEPKRKNYIFAGRNLVLKNGRMLRDIFSQIGKSNSEIILDEESLPFEEYIKKIENCYAVIVPSLSEIGSIAALDALERNKPFILTEESGLWSRLKDVGVFVDPKNPDDIREKIMTLAEPEEYDRIKKRIEGFSFRHTWEEIVDEFIEIAEKIK